MSRSNTTALVAAFFNIWPWTAAGKVVAPLWSERRETLSSPAEHFVAIFDDEVRAGKVRVETLVDWISLLENAKEVELEAIET